MYHFIRTGLLALISILLFGCGSAAPPVEEIGIKLAEYDGAYVLTQADRFLPLEEADTATTRILYSSNGRISTSQALRAKDRMYTLSDSTQAVLDSSVFKGVFVKGNYQFKYFSLHPLNERILKEGGRELFFEKKGGVDYDIPFFMPGDEIDILRRSADEENGYYFEVKEPLQSGKYVAWISKYFWIFEITGLEKEVETESEIAN